MKPDQQILLFLVFLTGVFAGAAVQILFFAPQYQAPPVEERSRLSIVGEMYGGCRMAGDTCPSFRIDESGTYQYLAEGERSEGTLPAAIANPILSTATDYRLRSLAAPLESDECSSFVDGIDYRYEITLDSTRYILDTCRTSLGYDSELQKNLLEAWQYMDNPTKAYPTIIEEGVGAWLIERFRSGADQQ